MREIESKCESLTARSVVVVLDLAADESRESSLAAKLVLTVLSAIRAAVLAWPPQFSISFLVISFITGGLLKQLHDGTRRQAPMLCMYMSET